MAAIPEYLRRIENRIMLLEDRYIELSDRVDEIDRRLMLVESLLAPAGAGLPMGSRWVLEIFPDEIDEWAAAIRSIPQEPLTERERSFLRNLEYYIRTERKITLPQLMWLSRIQRRVGGVMPKIPIPPTGGSHHSNPVRAGQPKTDVERIMAHYGISREEAEEIIAQVMEFYGVSREEAIKGLLPPRGTKVKKGSKRSPAFEGTPLNEEIEEMAGEELKPKRCPICGAEIPPLFSFCPKCFAPIEEV